MSANARELDGAWRVREYVYDGAGALVGTVRQRRTLLREGDAVRVVQECHPDRSLDGHPLARFAGRHEFLLDGDGHERRYHGPAVLGHGRIVGPGCTVGRGVWPAFGHHFRSWAALVEPARQLTGGRFARVDDTVARIVGVAEREASADAWPALDGPTWPGELATTWHGQAARALPDGQFAVTAVTRRYHAHGWEENVSPSRADAPSAPMAIALARDGDSWRVDGHVGAHRLGGFARGYGWARQLEFSDDRGDVVTQLEVLDAVREHLVVFGRRIHDNDAWVLRLRPAHHAREERS